jgi:hypothetical protein
MDENDDMTPFPREPWQRLLAEDSSAPSETTDARIRAAARRDLAPRGRRWWLPASLAASFVLAVFVVQSQLGTVRVPIVTDADHGAGGAITARIIDREEAEAARPPGQAPAAAGTRRAKAEDPALTDEYGYQDSEIAADSAGSGPRVGGPERELQAANEMPEGLAPSGPPVLLDAAPSATPPGQPSLPAEPSPPAPPSPPSPASPAAAMEADGREKSGQVMVTSAAARRDDAPQEPPATTRIRPPPYEKTPESWYAYVEKLRSQGKVEEADRQLERLEKAHPGWVERYLRDRARP